MPKSPGSPYPAEYYARKVTANIAAIHEQYQLGPEVYNSVQPDAYHIYDTGQPELDAALRQNMFRSLYRDTFMYRELPDVHLGNMISYVQECADDTSWTAPTGDVIIAPRFGQVEVTPYTSYAENGLRTRPIVNFLGFSNCINYFVRGSDISPKHPMYTALRKLIYHDTPSLGERPILFEEVIHYYLEHGLINTSAENATARHNHKRGLFMFCAARQLIRPLITMHSMGGVTAREARAFAKNHAAGWFSDELDDQIGRQAEMAAVVGRCARKWPSGSSEADTLYTITRACLKTAKQLAVTAIETVTMFDAIERRDLPPSVHNDLRILIHNKTLFTGDEQLELIPLLPEAYAKQLRPNTSGSGGPPPPPPGDNTIARLLKENTVLNGDITTFGTRWTLKKQKYKSAGLPKVAAAIEVGAPDEKGIPRGQMVSRDFAASLANLLHQLASKKDASAALKTLCTGLREERILQQRIRSHQAQANEERVPVPANTLVHRLHELAVCLAGDDWNVVKFGVREHWPVETRKHVETTVSSIREPLAEFLAALDARPAGTPGFCQKVTL